jgi:VanZ family protein
MNVKFAFMNPKESPRLRDRATKLFVVCSWLALTVLSLVPGHLRPHTGMPGNAEHLVAYALAGAASRIGWQRIPSRNLLLAFSIASAFFEICQIWIPGRTAGIDNWIASTFGALIGISVGQFLIGNRGSRAPT